MGDVVIVPIEATARNHMTDVLDFVHSNLAEAGTALVFFPGRDLPASHQIPAGSATAAELVELCRRRNLSDQVSFERFGNAVTGRAVANGTRALDVPGVLIDHHDADSEVLIAVTITRRMETIGDSATGLPE